MTYPSLSDLRDVRNAHPRQEWVADVKQYGVPDFWSMLTEIGGDCEDWVLTWVDDLLALGWPIEALRIGICFVEPYQLLDKATQTYRWANMSERCHAVLQVTAGPLTRVLDQRQPLPCTLRELQDLGYIPFEIQDAKTRLMVAWRWVGTQPAQDQA